MTVKPILADTPHPDTRELRALELHRTRGHEVREIAPDIYRVPSCSGADPYRVDYEAETCNCPDFRRHHRPCKHLYAARVVKAKTAACEGCSRRVRRRDLVEVTEENSAFTLSVFVGEQHCRSCAGDRGIL